MLGDRETGAKLAKYKENLAGVREALIDLVKSKGTEVRINACAEEEKLREVSEK